jgi:hypothetical protein
MPNFIKPILKLTEPQRKALLKRIIEKQSSSGALERVGLSPDAMLPEAGGLSPLDQAMKETPASSMTYGRLGISQGEGMGTQMQNYPWPEAKMRYIQNPESFTLPEVPPKTNRLHFGNVSEQVPEGAFSEEMKFRPVFTEGERKAAKAMAEDTVASPGALEGLPPRAKTFSEIKQGDLLENAVTADAMWKFMGGGRSAFGRMWQMYNDSAPSKFKSSEAKDFFVKTFLRYRTNPENALKTQPREAKALHTLYTEFESSLTKGGGGE